MQRRSGRRLRRRTERGEFPKLGSLAIETVGVLSAEDLAGIHVRTVAGILGDVCDADLCRCDVLVGSARAGMTVERALWLRASVAAIDSKIED